MQSQSTEGDREYEIVVWGATGFTGKLVADYIAKEYGDQLKWAVAGRDFERLKKVVDDLLVKYPTRLKSIPIITADSGNLQSLIAMTARTQVIITTVGPFAKYGTDLISACVKTKTHYTDITGEADWVKGMISQFHDQAQKDGTYIVNCCGMDCIPSDINTLLVTQHVKQKYGKECTQVKGYHSFKGPAGLSGGTAASIVNAFDSGTARGMRKPFFLNSNPNKRASDFEKDQVLPFFDPDIKRWTKLSPFALCDNRIVRRSQELLQPTDKAYGELFQYNETEQASSLIGAIIWTLSILLFMFLLSITFTRRLLHKHVLPASGQGPKEEDRAKVTYQYKVIAKLANPSGKEPKSVTAIMKCGEPGYTETSKMLTESAICILKERNQFVLKGGVLTPAACMGENLVKRLSAKGFIFAFQD